MIAALRRLWYRWRYFTFPTERLDLDVAVLTAIRDLAPNTSGVTIRDRVRENLGREVPIGAIRAAVGRLEAAGFVAQEERGGYAP
jgi:hypothetical protein